MDAADIRNNHDIIECVDVDVMALLKKLLGGNVLFYPGCMLKFVGHGLKRNYEEILRKCGIDFIQLKDLEACCGSPVNNAGYLTDFKSVVNKNIKVFRDHGIKKIITPCPACFKTFKLEYPKIADDFDFEVEHITQTIADAIKSGKLKLKLGKQKKATYHDPCHLGRHCGIYDEPRDILKALGYKVVEMDFSRENAYCGGGLQSNYPELSDSIAKDRIKQAKATKTDLLVTCCPMCVMHLKKTAKGIKVKELSSLLINRIK